MTFGKEINKDNPLGTGGEVVTQLASLYYSMWNKACAFGYVNPSTFKKVFCSHSIMFQGYDQHDSAEFLAGLLDYIHEDVNRVKDKKYVEIPELEGTD